MHITHIARKEGSPGTNDEVGQILVELRNIASATTDSAALIARYQAALDRTDALPSEQQWAVFGEAIQALSAIALVEEQERGEGGFFSPQPGSIGARFVGFLLKKLYQTRFERSDGSLDVQILKRLKPVG